MECKRIVDDVYLKYIQYDTLHRRFYTYDVYVKCRLIDTDICSICNLEQESNVNMLLKCSHVIESWNQVCQWIIGVGGAGALKQQKEESW